MNRKLVKKSWKIMKLYNKKRIMKIVLIIFKHLIKMPHLKFSLKAPKVVESALVSIRVQILITTYFNILYFFFEKLFFYFQLIKHFFYYKNIKKIVFSLYSPKQVFENRKQKLLLNITEGIFPSQPYTVL